MFWQAGTTLKYRWYNSGNALVLIKFTNNATKQYKLILLRFYSDEITKHSSKCTDNIHMFAKIAARSKELIKINYIFKILLAH